MNDRTLLKKSLLIGYLKEFEYLCLDKIDKKTYFQQNIRRSEKLRELCPENPLYHLMEAAVMIRCGKREAGEEILKKYERNPALQFRNAEFRAGFIYLAGMLTEDRKQRRNIVVQLQKLYQKNAAQPSLYWYLVQLDDEFEKKPEKKIAFLEKQWKLGCRQNLLYMEVIITLKKYPEAAGNMDDFLMQCYIWAQRRNCITKEMGAQIAKQGMKLKRCDAKYEYLLKECYRIFSTKELLGALCSLYIRDGRMDQTAAFYYTCGVEFELKLNNLYEYYMMSTTEQKRELLPEQVLLYFLYHDVMTDSQRVHLYKNVISYGDKKSEIYKKYISRIEKYTVDSLLKRRISKEYAYLYDQILCPEIFSEEMAEAMADLMFLRKLTCTDPQIRGVEVFYEQLKYPKKAFLKKQQAYIPVYSPTALITLVDDQGNLYRNTISYQLEKLLDEKKYIDVCKKYIKNHEGLLLYLFGKRTEQLVVDQKTIEYCSQIPNIRSFKAEYRNGAALKVIEYMLAHGKADEIPDEWLEMDGKYLNREQRGKMIACLVQRKKYEQAFSWIELYGTVYVSANSILKILTALSNLEEIQKELFYRLCYGCFQNGQMNYTTLKYLADSFLGTCAQMTEIWKQAKAFGVNTFELEERILVQMMFTGTDVPEHFSVYLSYNQRNPEETIKKAYLTYMSREAFVNNTELEERFYFLLEDELFKKQGYAQVCILAYLKYLSDKEELSVKQKNMAKTYLKELFSQKCYYSFMQKFGKTIREALVLEDKIFIEYLAAPSSKVILHYMIEKEEEQGYRYTTCRLYPTGGGIFSKVFTLFEGEKIIYFITEKREDGTEISTSSFTKEKIPLSDDLGTRYERINRLQQLHKKREDNKVMEEMQKYRYLEMASDSLFPIE